MILIKLYVCKILSIIKHSKLILIEGLHEVYIYKDSINALGSPILVYVFDPDRVKVSDFTDESYINQPFSFNINAIEAGEGFIRVNVKGIFFQ